MYGFHAQLYNHLGSPILSQRGVAQGDNLSPFLFALALAPALERVSNSHSDVVVVSYLDDITIVGPADKVKEAWQTLQSELSGLGLAVNYQKCKLLVKDHADIEEVAFETDIEVVEDGVRILGVPVGSVDFQQSFLDTTHTTLISHFASLSLLDSFQHRFLLLYFCWSRKPSYLLRCLPPDLTEDFVDKLNSALWSQLQEWFGFQFSASQRLQLSLPLRYGGFGLGIHRGVARMAFFCGTLAAASDSQVSSDELDDFLAPITDLHRVLASFGESILADESLKNLVGGPPLQRDLCALVYLQEVKRLRSEAPIRMASLIDSYGAHSWLLARPGVWETWMANRTWLSAARLRLGSFPCSAGLCPLCHRVNLDESGYHLFSCSSLIDLRTDRHHRAVDSLAQILSAADLRVHTEQGGFRFLKKTKSSNKQLGARPDHFVWNFGVEQPSKFLATDVTVTNAARDVKSTMSQAADKKVKAYRNNIEMQADGPLREIPHTLIRFEPLVANVYGGWNDRTHSVLQEASLIGTARSGRFTDATRFRSWAWMKLSVAFQRVTAAFFDRFLHSQLSSSLGPSLSGPSRPGPGSLGTAALDIQLLNLAED